MFNDFMAPRPKDAISSKWPLMSKSVNPNDSIMSAPSLPTQHTKLDVSKKKTDTSLISNSTAGAGFYKVTPQASVSQPGPMTSIAISSRAGAKFETMSTVPKHQQSSFLADKTASKKR